MSNPSLSSQDVRTRVLSLRDELIRNLEFIQSCIEQDREEMQKYFRQFKDLRYRPVLARDVDGNPTEYGSPTEIVREPLAVQFRTTVKSLLDSIRVIESEILPEDNPEGRDTGGERSDAALKRRAALREGFQAPQSTPDAPKPVDVEVQRAPKPVEPGAEPVKAPVPKPWRETQPKALPEAPKPIAEATPIEPVAPKPPIAAPIGLSPALRAQLSGSTAGAGGSRTLDAMRDKYASPKTKKSKD